MVATGEARVKNLVKQILGEVGCHYFMPASNGYGTSGTSDFVGFLPPMGLGIAIETKSGKNKPTALQERFLQKVRDAGGLGLVINEENIGSLKETLLTWSETRGN